LKLAINPQLNRSPVLFDPGHNLLEAIYRKHESFSIIRGYARPQRDFQGTSRQIDTVLSARRDDYLMDLAILEAAVIYVNKCNSIVVRQLRQLISTSSSKAQNRTILYARSH